MSSVGLKARRAGTDGIPGARLLLGIERSKGKRRKPFHGRGRAAKGRLCGFFDDVKNWPEAEVFKSDRQLRPLISAVSPAFDEVRCRLKDSYDRDCNPSES